MKSVFVGSDIAALVPICRLAPNTTFFADTETMSTTLDTRPHHTSADIERDGRVDAKS